MTTFIRRLPVFALAAALLASVAVEPALAQGGGIPTSPGGTTSLSNEGAPTGGTGNIGTTRVGPSRQTARSQRQRARRPARVARRAPARPAAPAPVSDTGLAPR